MEAKKNPLESGCSFAGLKPIMVDLPYPPVQVSARNPSYANLLGVDYCGSVSEMSAITQYINNENRISCEDCPMARTSFGDCDGGDDASAEAGRADFPAGRRGGFSGQIP